METKKHYIAYMDILGYSAYISEHPDEANDFLETIISAIEKIKQSIENFTNISKKGFHTELNIKYKAFSDNILICMEATDNTDEIHRITLFLLSVASIQRGLFLQHKLLLRGGITIGELFINNDFVFGQGLIDAVELEKRAENPCIIISDEFATLCQNSIGVNQEDYEKIEKYVKAKNNNEKISKSIEKYYNENGEEFFTTLFYTQALRTLISRFENELLFLNYLFDMSDIKLFGIEFLSFMKSERKRDPQKFNNFMVCSDPIPYILKVHGDILAKKITDYCHYDDIDIKPPAHYLFSSASFLALYMLFRILYNTFFYKITPPPEV